MQVATTRWSLIARAAKRDGSAQALAELCALWRPAILAFLRHKTDSNQAEDLTQGFFLHFIESGLSARADPERGRFRSFLYSALQRWLIDQQRAQRSAKRGGGAVLLEQEGLGLNSTDPAPDALFDREWAACLLREGLRRLRDEADQNGRAALYRAALPFLLEDPDPGDYAEASRSLDMAPNTFAVAVSRLRKRLQAQVKQLVLDTSLDESEAAIELRHLRASLRERDR